MEKNTQPIEMALEAAALVMQSGGSTIAAERSFSNILSGFKEKEVSAVWRLDFVAATADSTFVRPIGPIGVNLVRAAEVEALGDRVAKGEIETSDIGAEVERIKALPQPYRRWETIAAAGFAAAFFSQLAGGDWGSLAFACVGASVGQLLRSVLQPREFSVAVITLICGLISACTASTGLRFGFSRVESATLIASVVYMVPGLPLINGFIDIVSHKYLFVGIERIANAMFLFLVLAIAIALASTVIL